MRQNNRSSSPSRWTWLILLTATAFVAACDTSLEGFNTEQTWGFITVTANKSGAGAHFADAEGLFFRGNLSAVPNAEFTSVDTCTDALLSEGNNLGGVTYLDAGPTVATTVGATAGTLDRTTTSGGIAYLPTSPIAYTPGDSIFITVTGAAGGFPAGNIRAKTAEAFTISDIVVPAGTDSIPITWTPSHDTHSRLVISLRYATVTTPTVLSRNVVCTFNDDGVGAIPFRHHERWSTSTGVTAVVATRLRTSYVVAGDGNLGVISTYQVPTPPHP